jgi:hypothetical protein
MKVLNYIFDNWPKVLMAVIIVGTISYLVFWR